MTISREVMLVGSVPLGDARTVMIEVASKIGEAIVRIPDGETGPRSKFISWQEKVFAQVEQLDVTPLGPQSEWGPNGELPPHTVKLRADASGEPKFPPTGYASEALKSYESFAALKLEGLVPRRAKFQIGLPTPLGVLSAFGDEKFQRYCEVQYSRRMKEDLDVLAAKIPHSEYTIQWDLPLEIGIWEGQVKTALAAPRKDVVAKLCEMIQHSPIDVRQGLHLCYGDISHRHWKEPDLKLMVEFSNAVQSTLDRSLDYVHFPIPRTWLTSGDYEALKGLRLSAATKVFLGLLHVTDGIDGAKTRIGAAKAHLPEFGIASSCGLGRRKPAALSDIFALYRQASTLET